MWLLVRLIVWLPLLLLRALLSMLLALKRSASNVEPRSQLYRQDRFGSGRLATMPAVSPQSILIPLTFPVMFPRIARQATGQTNFSPQDPDPLLSYLPDHLAITNAALQSIIVPLFANKFIFK